MFEDVRIMLSLCMNRYGARKLDIPLQPDEQTITKAGYVSIQ